MAKQAKTHRSPVAKHAGTFHSCHAFVDRKKEHKRGKNVKHKGQWPSQTALEVLFGKAMAEAGASRNHALCQAR